MAHIREGGKIIPPARQHAIERLAIGFTHSQWPFGSQFWSDDRRQVAIADNRCGDRTNARLKRPDKE
jgi:hypothetical protein